MLRRKEETSRAGSKWLLDEDEKLVKEITDKKTIEEIALEHKRTIGGIRSRIISHILYKEYNIERELVEKHINKIETNKAIIKSCEEKPKLTMMLLFEKMLTIEQKIDSIIRK
jgi:autonomous glycyl radical cofactor GrcA